MSLNISVTVTALSYIVLSAIAFIISRRRIRRSSRQGMSRNAHDLDQRLRHSELNNGSAPDKMQRLIRAKGKVPQVAVIGAGVAGLRCADVLIQAGVNVTLYEARNRVGGRVHQVESGGHLVDLGANWLHGNAKSNPITQLAAKTKTVIHEWEDRQAVIDSTGHRMDDGEARAYSEIVWEIIAQAFKYSNDCSSSIDPQKSLMDYFKEEVPKRETNPAKVEEILKMAQRWGAFVGDPIERQSLKYFFLEETIEGDTAFVADTYQKVFREIAANALAHAEVHFNTEIKHIRAHGPVHHTISDEPQSKGCKSQGTEALKVSLQTSDEPPVEREFDEVVVTAPLGWLKAHKQTAFTPLLPRRLSEAMDNISYGRLEKCYITFPTPFWNGPSFSSETQAETVTQPNLLNLPISTTTPPKPQHNNSANPTTTTTTATTLPYPPTTHFQSPLYVPYPPSQSQPLELLTLSSLPGPTAHPTLLFYVFGPCATALAHLLKPLNPSNPSNPAYNTTLASFFSPFYSLLPHYTPECVPTAFLATQWQNDRFAGYGSYTNYQVGLEAGDEDIRVMRRGWPEGGVWFAGEHTGPFEALGTTTGAYAAGEGVAGRILGAYGMEVPGKGAGEGEGVEKVERMNGADGNGLVL